MGELWADHISFSQLTMADECPYSYYLQKMIGVEPVGNAFSQAGTLAHELLAAWAKGEISAGELPRRWAEQFDAAVTAEFPPFLAAKGYAEKLFDGILRYFETFDGFPGYEILGVEKEFHSALAGERFVGVIDLILRHKATGGLMLVDHKSCSLSTFRRSREKMYRQLLLYSKYCADEYGAFPETLCFNLFKESLLDERPFDCAEYRAAKGWAEGIVREMRAKELTDWFETRPEFFRCVHLCNCRTECCFGKPENHKRKEDICGTRRTPAAA